jgi:hypothetical protein
MVMLFQGTGRTKKKKKERDKRKIRKTNRKKIKEFLLHKLVPLR